MCIGAWCGWYEPAFEPARTVLRCRALRGVPKLRACGCPFLACKLQKRASIGKFAPMACKMPNKKHETYKHTLKKYIYI